MAGPNGNDVFWQDRAARDNSDYNGSGIGGSFYDESAERRQRFSSIKAYIIFIAICLFLIFITSYVLAGDIRLKSGNSVEVPYDRANSVAYVYDSNNKSYAVQIDALAQLNGDTVVLYYTGDNIASARPVTVVWFYVVMYMAWIAILAFLVFAAWKKFHGSHHAVEHTGKSRFDD
ncbi:MAG: hypothetical protein PUD90_03895 [Clostridia bacterium]|nr:hypothetical protein [[Bacteroides] pectinophilus]MDD5872581.1 hypothetical protein [Clostridia bacterium]